MVVAEVSWYHCVFECHDSVIRQRNMVCVFIYFVVGFGKS